MLSFMFYMFLVLFVICIVIGVLNSILQSFASFFHDIGDATKTIKGMTSKTKKIKRMPPILIPTITTIPTNGAVMHGGKSRSASLTILCMSTMTGRFLGVKRQTARTKIVMTHGIIIKNKQGKFCYKKNQTARHRDIPCQADRANILASGGLLPIYCSS